MADVGDQGAPRATYKKHEAREKEVMGAGYEAHERAERAGKAPNGDGGFSMPKAKSADGWRSAGHKRDGALRNSGHAGAHRIGKR